MVFLCEQGSSCWGEELPEILDFSDNVDGTESSLRTEGGQDRS